MDWIAYMKDGSIIRETDEFNFNELDGNLVDRFRITESGNNIAVPYSSDSGIIRFTNLDLTKLKNLKDGENLVFEFNKERGFFKLNKESLDLYNSIMLKDQKHYYFIEFDQTGVFNINGDSLYCGIDLQNGRILELKNSPPYNEIIQYKNGMTEVRMQNNTAVNKNDKTLNYVIGYKKQYLFDDLEFSVHNEIVYDLVNRYVKYDFRIQGNISLSCKIFMSYNDRQWTIPLQLTANSPMHIKRILNVIG